MDGAAARRGAEIRHGRSIADRAERIWGWGTAAGARRARRRAAALVAAAGIGPGCRVLELGCGTGLFTRSLAERGAAVVGVDLSWDLLQEARARGEGGARFALMDAEGLAFRDAVFDAVVGVSVLHHLVGGSPLAEIRRVLRPGGRVAFSEPNLLNPQVFLTKTIPPLKRWMGDVPHETAFVRWGLARALAGCGFAGIRVVPFDFLHPWTPRAFIPWVEAAGRLMERIPGIRELAGSLFITAVVATGGGGGRGE